MADSTPASGSSASGPPTRPTAGPIVRTPASSANLGSGFDVLGMALDVHADIGLGAAPSGATALDDPHPARVAFVELGGEGPIWMRCRIPMARGLGFSGAVRVGAAALAVVLRSAGSSSPEGGTDPIDDAADEILAVTTRLEGHGDNVAASLLGGVVANVDGRPIPLRVGPVLGSAVVIAWIPDTTTPTDRSRRSLAPMVERAAAVHNLARSIQLALAIEHDDPNLLDGATSDQLHQADRLPRVPGAAAAISDGVEAGAWCAWLSGSGPTVALLCPADRVDAVTAALPPGGHVKALSIDRLGARVVEP
jgi:homoserine kinase